MVWSLSIGLFAWLAKAALSVTVQRTTDASNKDEPVRRVPKEGAAQDLTPVRRVQDEKQIEVVVGSVGRVTHEIQKHVANQTKDPAARTTRGCTCKEAGDNTNFCYTHGAGYDWCYVNDDCDLASLWEKLSEVSFQKYDNCVKRADTTHGFHCKNDGSYASTCGNWCEARATQWAVGTYSWCYTTNGNWDYCALNTTSCASVAGIYADSHGSSFSVTQTNCDVSFTYNGASMSGTVSDDFLQVCDSRWGEGNVTRAEGTTVTKVAFNSVSWTQQS